jgi:ribonuclease-3
VWRLLKIPKKLTASDKKLIAAIENLAGFTPANLSLYRLATVHSSVAPDNGQGIRESNERLEYLGDAVLGAVVADYLFKKFPYKDEGFLTEIRSRIVNRESLNFIARKMGIASIVRYDEKNLQLQQVILGNTLEAIVGAVYLDKGYARCKRFVIQKLINPYVDLDNLIHSNPNYKSQLIEWGQRENRQIRFEVESIKNVRGHREFTSRVWIDDKPHGVGYGLNKKKAEQDAAWKTCLQLGILNEPAG